MERIIYISTCRTDPDRKMVEDILRESRRNNLRDGLTGLLVVGNRRFLQVLEGPREFIDAAYARIKADRRHFALVELSRKHVAMRAFAGWDMGCEQLDGGNLGELIARLTKGVDDADLRAQFQSFAALHNQAA